MNQKAFSIIGILIVLVVVAVLAILNWESLQEFTQKENPRERAEQKIDHFKKDVQKLEQDMQERLDEGLQLDK